MLPVSWSFAGMDIFKMCVWGGRKEAELVETQRGKINAELSDFSRKRPFLLGGLSLISEALMIDSLSPHPRLWQWKDQWTQVSSDFKYI